MTAIDHHTPHDLSDQPPELVRHVAAEAERDADDVIAFLDAAGLTPSPGETVGVPPGVLLDLGAVVRLRRWEAAGLTAHTAAGLPSARVALDAVIRTLEAAAVDPAALAAAGQLGRTVFDVTVTRFAWTARPALGADVVLDVADEDALVDALARHLWAHRHDTPAPD